MFRYLAVAVLLALAGCVQSSGYPIGPARFSPTTNVAVLTSPPAASFVEIGIVEASGGSNVSMERLINGLKSEAEALGADAIILGGEASSLTGGPVYGSMMLASRKTWRATAIKMTP